MKQAVPQDYADIHSTAALQQPAAVFIRQAAGHAELEYSGRKELHRPAPCMQMQGQSHCAQTAHLISSLGLSRR